MRFEPSFQNSGCWQLPLYSSGQGALWQPCSLPTVFWSLTVHTQFTRWLGLRAPLPFRYLWVHRSSWRKNRCPMVVVGERQGLLLLHHKEWHNGCHLLFTITVGQRLKSTLCRLSLILTWILKIRHYSPPCYTLENWVQERLNDCPCLAPRSICLGLHPRFLSGCGYSV